LLNASEEKFTQNKTWRILFFQHYDHTIRMFLKRHNENVNMMWSDLSLPCFVHSHVKLLIIVFAFCMILKLPRSSLLLLYRSFWSVNGTATWEKRSKTAITHRQTHTHTHTHTHICADKPRCEPVTRTEHPLTDTWQGFVWVNRHTLTHTHTHTYDYLLLCAGLNCIPGRRYFGCLWVYFYLHVIIYFMCIL